MNKKMKRITLFTALLVLLISIPSTLAYFSAYKTSTSSHTLKLVHSSKIDEEVDKWKKEVTITADEDSGPIYVRAKAFAPEALTLSYNGGEQDEWEEGEGGFWYYKPSPDKPLFGGESTETPLVITWDKAMDDAEEFHVVVVYEATPAVYENGNWTCDWSVTVGGGN